MNLNYYMKCSNCGKEFGDGIKCQNCGVDRVTGLGNYSGYNVPSSDVMDKKEDFSYTEQKNHSIISQYHTANVGSIVCYACGEVIPDNSKFCPYCSKELYVTCPKCGQIYSSQYPVCSQCGTNRKKYYDQKRLWQSKIETVENIIKKEQGDCAAIEKLTRKIELNQKLRASTPEGRAELERERRYIDECRKKWRN